MVRKACGAKLCSWVQPHFRFVGIEGRNSFKNSFMNRVMQLRKCCNHPYLFAEPIRGDAEATTGMQTMRRVRVGLLVFFFLTTWT